MTVADALRFTLARGVDGSRGSQDHPCALTTRRAGARDSDASRPPACAIEPPDAPADARRAHGGRARSTRDRRARSRARGRVVRVLEPLVTEAAAARLQEVIARRLASVAVVFDAPHDPHNGAAVVRSCEAFGVQRLHVVERAGTFLAARLGRARRARSGSTSSATRKRASAIAVGARDASARARRGAPGRGARAGGSGGDARGSRSSSATSARGSGRDRAARARARVRVPMRGFVESLNVSVTAAILSAPATRGRTGDLDADARCGSTRAGSTSRSRAREGAASRGRRAARRAATTTCAVDAHDRDAVVGQDIGRRVGADAATRCSRPRSCGAHDARARSPRRGAPTPRRSGRMRLSSSICCQRPRPCRG